MTLIDLLLAFLTAIAGIVSPLWPSEPQAAAPAPDAATLRTEVRYVCIPTSAFERIDEVTHTGVRDSLDHGGAILSPSEFEKLIKHIQADRRNSVLTFPHFQSEPERPATFCSMGVAFEVSHVGFGTPAGAGRIRVKGLIKGPAKAASPESQEIRFNNESALRAGETALMRGCWSGQDKTVALLLVTPRP